jgi:hypothetical protein
LQQRLGLKFSNRFKLALLFFRSDPDCAAARGYWLGIAGLEKE